MVDTKHCKNAGAMFCIEPVKRQSTFFGPLEWRNLIGPSNKVSSYEGGMLLNASYLYLFFFALPCLCDIHMCKWALGSFHSTPRRIYRVEKLATTVKMYEDFGKWILAIPIIIHGLSYGLKHFSMLQNFIILFNNMFLYFWLRIDTFANSVAMLVRVREVWLNPSIFRERYSNPSNFIFSLHFW